MYHREILIEAVVNGHNGFWELVPFALEESDIKSDDKKCVWINLGWIPHNYADMKDRGMY